MARPDERRFVTFRRGYVRDSIILANFRIALRNQFNPDTSTLFTEDEIARITQEGSRYYIEADAIDLVGQGYQQRAMFFADQGDPRRAADPFLYGVWKHWVGDPLPASGGSGKALVKATPGTIILGDTTLGAPGVHVARDEAGNRYQVLISAVTPSAIAPEVLGQVTIDLKGIDTGTDTNPVTGTVLTWVSPPPGAEPTLTVTQDFAGGFDAETSQEYADRIVDVIADRPASGNNAHFRAWARRSTISVESAFVYACYAHAGSTQVCVLQKRGTTSGPLARIANLGTMTVATAFLTPPNSPEVPERVFVLVTTAQSVPNDTTLALRMDTSSTTGWFDRIPFPTAGAHLIDTVTDGTHFSILGTTGQLPEGVSSISGPDTPHMMVWDEATSRFTELSASSIVESAPGTYDVTLSTPATLVVGQSVSPFSSLHETIAETVEAYYDEICPGELVDSLDLRFHRAYRDPRNSAAKNYRVGSTVINRLQDSLGPALVDGTATYDLTEPGLPDSVVDGPKMLTLGNLFLTVL
jgi:hypothetical protein